ncbi:MAG TPA: threonyl-tRNA synthetase editing domain-containing protein [bacterium]|nr:threonyl-tRNA synthetase editing domain-containing protein [bacterium]
MKALIWYCKKFKISDVKKSTRMKPIIQDLEENLDEKKVVVPWVTIESHKDENFFSDFLNDLKIVADKFKTKKIILCPFAHFASKIPSKEISFEIFCNLADYLIKNGFEVKKVHFGSYKNVLLSSPASEYQVMFRSYSKEFIRKK